MRYVEVQGVKLSVVGLGAWQFGSRGWGYGSDYADREAVAITERARELGINLIDTAEAYGFGQSERIVGRAIAGHRDEVFLATKLLPVLPVAPLVEARARSSARRLGVERLDLYQLHWPNPVVPIQWTMRGMRDLQAAGVVGHAGVSNFSLEQWQEAERALDGVVLSNQVSYSLVARSPERAILPWAQANDRIVIAYSPLAQGLLSGRYDGTNTPRGVRAGNPLFLPDNIEAARPLLDALRQIATAHDVSPAQVALAWLIHRPNVVVIPGASSVAQVEANAAAADIVLTPDEDARLDETSAAFHPRGGAGAYVDIARSRLRR